MNDIVADRILDARGLFCPLPVLKARRHLRDMTTGQVLQIRATDKSAEGDFQALCEAQGLDYLGVTTEGRVMTFSIRKR